MIALHTTLTTSGNSTAVRLSKNLLRTSGISDGGRVRLEAKRGKIIISKSDNPRAEWSAHIEALQDGQEEPTHEFHDIDVVTANDGLDELPWDGPSFDEWQGK